MTNNMCGEVACVTSGQEQFIVGASWSRNIFSSATSMNNILDTGDPGAHSWGDESKITHKSMYYGKEK